MNKSQALKLSTRILIVFTILILVISLYSILSLIFSITSGTSNMNLDKNESTGDYMLSFSLNPRNNAFLDVSLFLEIKIFDLNKQVIATESKYVIIKPGGTQSLSLNLTIPSEFVPEGDLEKAQGYFQLTMSIKTLGDLIGLTQVMRIGSSGK